MAAKQTSVTPADLSADTSPGLRIWGCRGSVPVSGPQTLRHGGATTCFVVDLPGERVIIDAGSGLAAFGRQQPAGQEQHPPTTLLISHFHHDHILGFPFYLPLFQPGWELTVAAVPRAGVGPIDGLLGVHRQPWFPVPLKDAIQASMREDVLQERGELRRGELKVEWMEVPHPGGASAFRLSYRGATIVIATDIEIPQLHDDAFIRFCEGAGALLIDAQFRDEEYPRFEGWGHSTNGQAARFAQKAGVRELYLAHHDVGRSDDELDAMVREVSNIHPRVRAAAEGLFLPFDALSG